MKKIKVIVKGKTLLELAEPADKGDVIDLQEVVQVDTSYLDMLIESGKEKAYESKLEEVTKRLNIEKQAEIKELNNKIETLINQNRLALEIKEKDVAKQFNDKIAELNQQIESLKSSKEFEMKQLKSQSEVDKANLLKNENSKYSALKNEYDILKAQFDSKISEAKLEVERTYEHKISEIDAQNKLALAGKDAQLQTKDYEFEIQKNKVLQEQ